MANKKSSLPMRKISSSASNSWHGLAIKSLFIAGLVLIPLAIIYIGLGLIKVLLPIIDYAMYGLVFFVFPYVVLFRPEFSTFRQTFSSSSCLTEMTQSFFCSLCSLKKNCCFVCSSEQSCCFKNCMNWSNPFCHSSKDVESVAQETEPAPSKPVTPKKAPKKKESSSS